MFKRKLTALNHPQCNTFDAKDEAQFRSIMVWLEDQKIRHYKIEERAGLRNTASSDWNTSFEAYLKELGCPYQHVERVAVLDWLLGYSVRLEYGDNAEKFKSVDPKCLKQEPPAPGKSSNPLDSLNFEDPDFKAGIASLSLLLQVPPHPSHLEQLKAISILVKEKLSKEALSQIGYQGKIEQIPLDKAELGFETGDYVLNDSAKIIRLLHIRELRELQTKINAAIVTVQTHTANPKTDSRLGKVGR
ncbi:hypothetical protein ScPMuIL_013554 [Solemya velum]